MTRECDYLSFTFKPLTSSCWIFKKCWALWENITVESWKVENRSNFRQLREKLRTRCEVWRYKCCCYPRVGVTLVPGWCKNHFTVGDAITGHGSKKNIYRYMVVTSKRNRITPESWLTGSQCIFPMVESDGVDQAPGSSHAQFQAVSREKSEIYGENSLEL